MYVSGQLMRAQWSAQGSGPRKAVVRARQCSAQGSGPRKAAARARQRRAQGSQGRAPPWSCVPAFLFVEVSSVVRDKYYEEN